MTAISIAPRTPGAFRSGPDLRESGLVGLLRAIPGAGKARPWANSRTGANTRTETGAKTVVGSRGARRPFLAPSSRPRPFLAPTIRSRAFLASESRLRAPVARECRRRADFGRAILLAAALAALAVAALSGSPANAAYNGPRGMDCERYPTPGISRGMFGIFKYSGPDYGKLCRADRTKAIAYTRALRQALDYVGNAVATMPAPYRKDFLERLEDNSDDDPVPWRPDVSARSDLTFVQLALSRAARSERRQEALGWIADAQSKWAQGAFPGHRDFADGVNDWKVRVRLCVDDGNFQSRFKFHVLAYVEPQVFEAQGWKASWLNGAVASLRREYYPPRPPLITKDGPGGQLALGGRGALNGEVVLDDCVDPAGFDADPQGQVPRGAIALVDFYHIELDVERRPVPCVDPENPETAGLVGYRSEERVLLAGLPVTRWPDDDQEFPGLEYHADLRNSGIPALDDKGWEPTARGYNCVDPDDHEGLRTRRGNENVPCGEKWGSDYPEGTLTRTTETVIWPEGFPDTSSSVSWDDDRCFRSQTDTQTRHESCQSGYSGSLAYRWTRPERVYAVATPRTWVGEWQRGYRVGGSCQRTDRCDGSSWLYNDNCMEGPDRDGDGRHSREDSNDNDGTTW